MEYFKLNERVKIIGKNVKGTVAFIGETHFSDGILYGIVMDEPKGRNNGTVEGIRYFKCPKNQGTFVRVCQLQKESTDSEGSDKNGKSTSLNHRSMYPNYLKHSSKLTLEKSKYKNKSKEYPLRTSSEGKQQDSHISVTPGYPLEEKYRSCFELKEQASTSQIHSDDKENLLRETMEKLRNAKEELALKSNELTWRNRQIITLQNYLSKLKTCLRWNRKCDSHSGLKDNRLKGFLGHVIDSTMKNMEESINSLEIQRNVDYSRGDNALKAENNFLFQHVLDLEKQTEILLETMLQIRGIIVSENKKHRPQSKGDLSNSSADITDNGGKIRTGSSENSSKCVSDLNIRDAESKKLQLVSGKRGLLGKCKCEASDTKDSDGSTLTKTSQTFSDFQTKSGYMKRKQSLGDLNSHPSSRKAHRISPYSLSSRRQKKNGNGKTESKMKGITNELHEFISDIMSLAKKTTASDGKTNDSKSQSVEKGEGDVKEVYSDSDDRTDVIPPASIAGKQQKCSTAKKGRLPARRRKPQKKRIYSTRASSKKSKIAIHEAKKEKE